MFINLTNEWEEPNDKPRKSREYPSIITVHRIWFDDVPLENNLTIPDILNRFLYDPKVGKYTGYRIPYSIIINRWGDIFQIKKLTNITPHAKAWNNRALGVAVVGDYRKEELKPETETGLIKACTDLCLKLWINPLKKHPGSSVYLLSGHDELPGSSSDPNKVCPGFDMHKLRIQVHNKFEEKIDASKYSWTV